MEKACERAFLLFMYKTKEGLVIFLRRIRGADITGTAFFRLRDPLERWKTVQLWVASHAFHDTAFSRLG